MNVLSVFDGMRCGMIALERAGIEIDAYYASEIDNHALEVANDNYPSSITLGDISKWKEWDVDWASIDLLIGGSPCQGFSFAGKQLAFDDPRSALFFVYVEILRHIQRKRFKAGKLPPKFLLENVRMKKEYLDIISDILEVDHVFINSDLVSAQSRQRHYWANWEFEAPDDKNVLLNDILNGAFSDRKKSYCIDANYFKGSNLRRYFYRGSRQIVFKCEEFLKSLIDNKQAIEDMNAIGKSNRDKWRLLSVNECELLQTVPLGYTSSVSSSHAYKMLGNGWTVDVIAHIFRGLKANG